MELERRSAKMEQSEVCASVLSTKKALVDESVLRYPIVGRELSPIVFSITRAPL